MAMVTMSNVRRPPFNFKRMGFFLKTIDGREPDETHEEVTEEAVRGKRLSEIVVQNWNDTTDLAMALIDKGTRICFDSTIIRDTFSKKDAQFSQYGGVLEVDGMVFVAAGK